MGVEPTQDGSTAPQTVLKTAPVTGPGAAPQAHASYPRAVGRARRSSEAATHEEGRGAVAGAPPLADPAPRMNLVPT